MSRPDGRPSDVFGLAPYGEAVKIMADAAVQGAGAFLGRLCMPAVEEVGLLLRDKVSSWRRCNALAVLHRAQEVFDRNPTAVSGGAHPRLLFSIVEHASWTDDPGLQAMWAGLLLSSASGTDENLPFVDLLSRITRAEARIVDHACTAAQKYIPSPGLLASELLMATSEELMTITGISEVHHLDRDLDHLRSLELIDGGFDQNLLYRPQIPRANITPTALALNLYVRCHGHLGPPAAYFGLAEPPCQTG